MHGIVLYIDRVFNKCAIFSVILSDTMTFTTILQPCLADYFGMGRNMLIFKLLSLSSKSPIPHHTLGYWSLKSANSVSSFAVCSLSVSPIRGPRGKPEGRRREWGLASLRLLLFLSVLSISSPSSQPDSGCQPLSTRLVSLHSSEWAWQHFFLTEWKLSSIGLFLEALVRKKQPGSTLFPEGLSPSSLQPFLWAPDFW